MPCPDGGGEYQLSFTGKVILDKRFINPSAPFAEIAAQAAREQVKYLFGFFGSEIAVPKNEKIYLSAKSPEIKLGEIATGSYGADLKVDSLPDGTPEVDYIRQAKASGMTASADPAFHISYRASVFLAGCSQTAETFAVPDPMLPFDPYLAYWLVPKDHRRSITYNGHEFSINPCAYGEMVDLKRPSYYYYAWDPVMRGRDATGAEFNCAESLKSSVQYGTFAGKTAQVPRGPSFHFGEALREGKGITRGGLILGPLETWTKPFNIHDVAAVLQNAGSTSKSVRDYLANYNSRDAVDAGTLGFYSVLSRVDDVIDYDKFTSKLESSHILLSIDGKFKVSHRPVSLTIYFGTTDGGSKTPPEDWPFLIDALQKDDFLLYLGHAGMGENLNLEKIRQSLRLGREKLKAALTKKKHMLIGILGCRAYSFYGEDLLALRRKAGEGSRTDLALMATTSHYNPILSLAMLHYIDYATGGNSPTLYSFLEPYLASDDAFVFETSAETNAEEGQGDGERAQAR